MRKIIHRDGQTRGSQRRMAFLIFCLLPFAFCLLPSSLRAQTARNDAGSAGPAQFGDLLNSRAREGPIDIASQGGTTYSQTPAGRVATGTTNVVITTDDAES